MSKAKSNTRAFHSIDPKWLPTHFDVLAYVDGVWARVGRARKYRDGDGDEHQLDIEVVEDFELEPDLSNVRLVPLDAEGAEV